MCPSERSSEVAFALLFLPCLLCIASVQMPEPDVVQKPFFKKAQEYTAELQDMPGF